MFCFIDQLCLKNLLFPIKYIQACKVVAWALPINVKNSKKRVLFDSTAERIIDALYNPLEQLRINVFANCFSANISLQIGAKTTELLPSM